MAQDDLSTVFVTSPPERVVERQGRLAAWDQNTFENTVDIDGEHVENMPVRSAVEALTFRAGDVVNLRGWEAADGGPGSWAIDGKLVVPGSGRAEEAIAFLTTALGTAVAAAVFADRIHFASVAAYEPTSSDSYTDLSTVGPTIKGIQVTGAGVMLVMVSAHADATIDTGDGQLNEFTYMSYDISGPTSRSANDADALVGGFSADPTSGDIAAGVFSNSTKVVPETGLTAGEYTITAKYKVEETLGGSPSATFGDRTLTVIAF